MKLNLTAADLHLHTWYSDGVLSPKQVVERFAGLGFQTLAITDHDTMKGVPEAAEAGAALGIEVIPGVEFSADADEGAEVHLLGYGIDISNQALNDGLALVQENRRERNDRLLAVLRTMGFDLDYTDLPMLPQWSYVGKPIIARAMVGKGYIGSVEEAFAPGRFLESEEARAVIAQANAWREKLLRERGTRFVFPSDEFYLQAGIEVPSDEEYEDYGQIDDGVGLLRLLHTEYVEAWEELPEEERAACGDKKVAIACGVSAAEFLRRLISEHPVSGVAVEVVAVENRFFGSNVTVSGLVTGNDLIGRMASVDCERVLITECMLRSEGDRFLDDVTLTEACERLGKPIVPVGRRGDELLDALLDCRG